MDPAALERYKQERGEAVLQWWRSYVDDVRPINVSLLTGRVMPKWLLSFTSLGRK